MVTGALVDGDGRLEFKCDGGEKVRNNGGLSAVHDIILTWTALSQTRISGRSSPDDRLLML
jgi:hypothetical protein